MKKQLLFNSENNFIETNKKLENIIKNNEKNI